MMNYDIKEFEEKADEMLSNGNICIKVVEHEQNYNYSLSSTSENLGDCQIAVQTPYSARWIQKAKELNGVWLSKYKAWAFEDYYLGHVLKQLQNVFSDDPRKNVNKDEKDLKFIRRNKKADNCEICKQWIQEGVGRLRYCPASNGCLTHDSNSGWHVSCIDEQECHQRRELILKRLAEHDA